MGSNGLVRLREKTKASLKIEMNLMDLMQGRITLKEGVISQNVAWSKVLQRATYIAFPTMLTEVSIAGLLA